MRKFLFSYWGIIIGCIILSVVILLVYKPDIGEPQTKTLQYDVKWDRFYVMENDEAVPIYRLTSEDYLIEGMEIDIYKHWSGPLQYPHGTPRDVAQDCAYFRAFGCYFLSCVAVLLIVTFFYAMSSINSSSNKPKKERSE